ncbi:deleted in malignant brain tumors 1 protein-like [Myxocyprinus asiaticus]|uniref:deleted in malignant brain tumors 1 protein-like n=1 Tax=Myxocyprinus asiaticus TaxID=70543 RepID=UPI002221DCA8|nr:deleted in malignant brain tumors 1 protein-like [Myxocyprinus asiaticus]
MNRTTRRLCSCACSESKGPHEGSRRGYEVELDGFEEDLMLAQTLQTSQSSNAASSPVRCVSDEFQPSVGTHSLVRFGSSDDGDDTCLSQPQNTDEWSMEDAATPPPSEGCTTATSGNEIRLVNGNNSCSGRVEVLHNGIWGTVCDDYWDLSDAAVVCREMGCGDVIEAKSVAYFGQGTGQIWMDNVNCLGTESALKSCTFNGWGIHNCYHYEDAGVICQSLVRLVNGINTCSGRLEFLYNGTWGTVCDDSWDLSDAAVVCREMGCGDVIEAKSVAYFGQGTGQIWMDNVNCLGTESTLKSCTFNGWGMHDCVHSEDAGVICQCELFQKQPITLQHSFVFIFLMWKIAVKLVNGDNICSGRVEVLHDGQWGTVCDDGWDLSDAAVVCREMGCGDVIEAKSSAYFGQGSGSIWLDDVQCTGSESTLKNCSSMGWGVHNCGHQQDAGVICQSYVRLTNGSDSCSGRVEVLHDGQWGTVCDDYWDLSDAAVVCREMGCGDVIEAKTGAYFGQGSGPIWMQNINCCRNESALKNCIFTSWGAPTCGHEKDAGVICGGVVRLSNSNSSCSGRVEVLHNGIWGTVCDDNWDLSDAAVVCREMGCGDVIEAKTGAYFGQGPGPKWMSNVNCNGTESTLKNCVISTRVQQNCSHEKDAGVTCGGKIRLLNGDDYCSGRVEILHNGQWGTVCDNGWDLSDAAVVCREMSCGDVVEAKTGAYYRQGSGLIWMDNVYCYGNESTLSSCGSHGWGINLCGHQKDAGVICQSHARLVNGSNTCSGRVEVLNDGQWGTVCDNGWDLSDAAVVCRELGCGDVIESKTGAYFGQGSGPIWMQDVNCSSNESTLKNCKYTRWGTSMCRHEKDAGVICGGIVRLANSNGSCSGTVEVLHDGQWGTVCDNGWDISDAAVVCREMGCGDVIEAKTGAYFDQGSGPVWMNNLNCNGTETTLKNCVSDGWGIHSCGHERDAGVFCQQTRLVNGNNCSGRVEVFHNDQWGTVCDNGWDLSDAAVVCREMGCGDVLEAKTGAYFGQGTGMIWLGNVNCHGTESTLRSCSSNGWAIQNCGHEKDAAIVCREIRLVNSNRRCSGRVEVLHNGQWGTVCSDGWDLSDAEVVCREMDCGNAIETKSVAYFGQGSGPIWMDDVICHGRESKLMSCRSNGWGIHNCGHEKDAGVICEKSRKKQVVRLQFTVDPNIVPNIKNNEVKILDEIRQKLKEVGNITLQWKMQSNGEVFQRNIKKDTNSPDCKKYQSSWYMDSTLLGRVEVLHNGQWGTVCDNGWALSDAAVVCRELGCGIVTETKSGAYFGQVKEQIWMDDVKCNGTESTLMSYRSNGWGDHNCGHEKDAGVICGVLKEGVDRTILTANMLWSVQLFLLLGFTTTTTRAKIRLVNGKNKCSGRVEVLHNQIWGTVCDDGWGLSDAAVVCREMGCGDVIEAKTGAYFGQGSGQIWMDDVGCYGTESTLKRCRSCGWGKHDCFHYEDAGVICQSVKLVNGFNICSGRVEVLHNGQWGTVCDNGWDLSDAAVVCREMGCGDVIEAKSGAYFGQGAGQIWMDDVNCFGTESTLKGCRSNGWRVQNCGHEKDAGVICRGNIRLLNGTNKCSGRVEVFYYGIWETVCDDGWDLSDAAVVCREMGCGDVIEAKTGAYFGQGSGLLRINNVHCTGSESTLKQCASDMFVYYNLKDAGVVCQSVKLVNGNNSCSGRVEVLYNGQWGTVCDDDWDISDAAVVCRELGCGDVIEAKTGSYFGHGSGPIWINNINCNGTESTLKNCISNGRVMQNCEHKKEAVVICEGKVRLVNGNNACSGRVEVLHNGEWGTVCDDDWDISDAAVVCREIGCGDVIEAMTGSYFGHGSGPIWINNINCNGTESTLKNCISNGRVMQNCEHKKEAVVICEGKVRLVNGNNACSGRVEVLHDGQWGTVCDDDWDISDAAVVCREMGCGDVIEAMTGSYFGHGSGPIWMSNVNCSRSESTLNDCKVTGWGTHNCGHEKDAGVICGETGSLNMNDGVVMDTWAEDDGLKDHFNFINDSKSWIDALQYCKTHHQTLVHILNDTVQKYITQMLQDKEITKGVWIGLERNMLFTCSPWLWTGGPYVDFALWHSTFPVDPMNRFCGTLLKNDDNTFGWVDACCHEYLPFICQG